MRISIRHELAIHAPPGTSNLVLQVLLTPSRGPTQDVIDWKVDMAGMDDAARFTDAYGNSMLLVNQLRPEGELPIVVTGHIETKDKSGVLGKSHKEPVPALYKRVTPLTKGASSIYGKFRGSKESRLSILHGLMGRVGEVIGGQENTQSQSADASAQAQSQSSQVRTQPPASEYAHSFVGACRALHIPARYVTGYLFDAPEGVSAFHAWAEAFDDKLGWIGFDPMLNLCPTDRHIRLAAGLDSFSAQPLKMVPVGNGAVHLLVDVKAT
jgi:hypothetical protein